VVFKLRAAEPWFFRQRPLGASQTLRLAVIKLVNTVSVNFKSISYFSPYRFLRSVKGYTRLDKIRSEFIRQELEISGIQDVRSKYKQNWINHLERMDNTGLPKHTLNYRPRGRRDRGRPRKRWQRVDAGTGQAT